MKVILSIVLLLALFITVFYCLDVKEQFYSTIDPNDLGEISSLECCGEGAQGPEGVTGSVGPQGPQGIQGIQGLQGDIGPDGQSAFEIADEIEQAKSSDQAYWASIPDDEDREEAWITSLTGRVGDEGERGPQGFTGPVTGVTGPVGKSAYNIAYEAEAYSDPKPYWYDESDKEAGEEAWLTSLTGQVGPSGPVGQDGQDGTNLVMPIGSIIIFHGTDTPDPEKWKVCNGVGTYRPAGSTQHVAIPDLSSLGATYIVYVGDTYLPAE
jgi:hypothetical protein